MVRGEVVGAAFSPHAALTSRSLVLARAGRVCRPRLGRFTGRAQYSLPRVKVGKYNHVSNNLHQSVTGDRHEARPEIADRPLAPLGGYVLQTPAELAERRDHRSCFMAITGN